MGKRVCARLCGEYLFRKMGSIWFDTIEANLDVRLLRFAHAVHIDESFVDLGSRVEHFFDRVVQIPKLHLLLKLFVRGRMVKIARFMNNDLTHFIGEKTLMSVKDAQIG